MTRKIVVFAAAVGSAFLLSWSGNPAAQTPTLEFAPNEVLVAFANGLNASARSAILASQGATSVERFNAVGVELVRLPANRDPLVGAGSFSAAFGVVGAQPNYVRRAVAPPPPNDPFWLNDSLWGMTTIKAKQVWDTYSTGSASIIIADVDTGVNYNHPDLAANMWSNPLEIPGNGIDDDGNGYIDDVYGIDTYNNDSNPIDDNGHGTHTSGTIAGVGNNGIGVAGVTWNSKILACKFLNSSGNGFDSGAIACFNYILAMKQRGENIRVTNNSWGHLRGGGPFPTAMQTAIDQLGNAGIINVFAAGNNNNNNDAAPYDPASIPSASIVSVAASTQTDARASFSNYGLVSVDLAAPGVGTISTYLGTGYASSDGTSMAAPHVAGAAALLLAIDGTQSVSALKSLILSSVDPLAAWNGVVATGGRLNVLTAATTIGNVAPTASVTSPSPGASFTAPATVNLAANASDSDGSVTLVEFFQNGTFIGSDATAPYTFAWTNVAAGSYALTARATDNRGAMATSTAVSIVVNPSGGGRQNVALASNGGVASASSTYSGAYPASATNNGDRRGLGWGSGGGWNDATAGAFPDWLQIQFNGTKVIDEINVFTLQDNFAAPIQPTLSTIFSQYGVTNFEVQTWTGSAWQTLPGGTVAGNNLVWRQFLPTPVSTDRIRVLINSALASYSRLVEVEAFGTAGTPNTPPTVSLTSPVDGSVYTAPASIDLAATANDQDGTVAVVEFYANGQLLGSDASAPYTFSWTNVQAGTYSLTAIARDNGGAATTSAARTVTVNGAPGRANVALASNGGVATASSTYSGAYPAASTNNGDRRGLGWGGGGGWNDNTAGIYPDWLQIQFNGTKSIDEINVVTLQDNLGSPIEPTLATTFSLYGITSFTVEYWAGSAWQTVPGGSVVGNNLVWRQFSFSPITTDRIRVLVTGALASYSRLTEVEAFGVAGVPNTPPIVSLTSPSPGAVFTAPADIAFAATASDPDGTISLVEFFANGALVGSDATQPYTFNWQGVGPGAYSLTAVARDNGGASTVSTAVPITVNGPPGRSNVALASNGGLASASSTYSSGYPPAGVIDGDRRGLNWAAGGGWNDATPASYPDWIEVQFNGTKVIDEINVFTVQDAFANPAEPTPSMTFTLYGITSFNIQYWTGSVWQTVPGGTIAGNNLVWRQATFAPITTDRVRVLVNASLATYSRVTEVEVFGTAPAPQPAAVPVAGPEALGAAELRNGDRPRPPALRRDR